MKANEAALARLDAIWIVESGQTQTIERLRSECVGSTKIAGASRCDVDHWPLPYLDKTQPSVNVRGPMPEKVVFA